MRNLRYVLLFSTPALVGLSVALSYYSYFANVSSPFNPYEALASIIFWIAVVPLIFSFPLRSIFVQFANYLRTIRGVVAFLSYLSVHLILYGLLLEGVLAYIYKIPAVTTEFSYYFSSTPFYPLSPASIVTGLGFNPSLSLIFPPTYNLALSLYSISLAFIIAIIVTSNVMRVTELGKMCTIAQKSRALVLLPALGVIGGAACCLSLPVLISLATPAAVALSYSPTAYYIAYFVFPPAAAIGLKFNMDSTNRIATNLENFAVVRDAK